MLVLRFTLIECKIFKCIENINLYFTIDFVRFPTGVTKTGIKLSFNEFNKGKIKGLL